jgi:Zn-dependent M28 family amino/carboxypeptidase
MRILTRTALRRLVILFAILGLLITWGWSSMIRMPLKSFHGPLPALTPAQEVIRDGLRQHVEKLAGEIGERNVFKARKLLAAADYIEGVFTNAGFKVTRQGYEVYRETCHNIAVEITGQQHSNEIVVVGAHYDSVAGCPGANDNGSGVAAVLELARVWSARAQPARTLRFVTFANEEPPFFQTEQMGSFVYAKQCRQHGDNIVAMLSLETIGYYATKKGSQKYPFPMGLFYPSRGDFIAFVGNTANAPLVRRCIESFRRQAAFPSEGAGVPGRLPGVDWSDHWSFWQAGYPGIMVTDTALFRYPYYHREQDTPDKLDYERLARVVTGLNSVLEDLVSK